MLRFNTFYGGHIQSGYLPETCPVLNANKLYKSHLYAALYLCHTEEGCKLAAVAAAPEHKKAILSKSGGVLEGNGLIMYGSTPTCYFK